ncbi:MAG: type IV pilus twitching motility protein PilT [Rhodothermales bacterium]
MSTALSLRTTGLQKIEKPELKFAPAQIHNALPKPPKVCDTLNCAVPAGTEGAGRMKVLAAELAELSDEQRLAMRIHVEELARHMIHLGASDLDAGGPAANEVVWYRTNGRKMPCVELGTIPVEIMDVLALNLLSEPQMETLFDEYAVDFSMEVNGEGLTAARRFRVSVYFDEKNLAINIRAIKRELRALDSMGFHPVVQQGLLFSNVRDGLTLITGVTGSGKSSTLDAIVDANNRNVEGHIVVIGDPVEYVHQSDKCIIRHREVGIGVASFKAGVVQSMRQDPDMIVIGEMRDKDTINATLEVTDSGHRIFSTLHTRSAVESIDRIIAEYPSEEQDRVRNRLADVLQCVISQKLCPRIGGGLVLAKEVLWMTPSIQAAIKNGNLSEIYQMLWEGNQKGQITLEQDLYLLMRKGQISPDTAMSYANNKKRLKQLLGG